MSDIFAMRGISVSHPKILFRNLAVVMHVKQVPLACMNPMLMKLSTREVNWHSNILSHHKFSNNILCENLLYPMECFKRDLQLIQWRKFEFYTTLLSKIYCNPLKI